MSDLGWDLVPDYGQAPYIPPDEPKPMFSCPFCRRKFSAVSEREVRRATKGNDESEITCPHCKRADSLKNFCLKFEESAIHHLDETIGFLREDIIRGAMYLVTLQHSNVTDEIMAFTVASRFGVKLTMPKAQT